MELKVGDKVKVRKETLLYGEYGDQIGLVTGAVDDGTPIHRITVEFDDGDGGKKEIQGINSSLFETAE